MTRRDNNLAVDDELDASQVIWASGTSDPQGISVGISKILYEHREVIIRCIGAASLNQAVKGVVIARGYIAQKGHDLVVRPGFINVPAPADMDTDTISALVLRITLG
jgi:stage V sporulation protein S